MEKEVKIRQSPIFYMGAKTKLLKQLLPIFPKNINNFYDLFGGSGVVSINVSAKNRYYNEINHNVLNLFKMFKENTPEELDKHLQAQVDKFGLEVGCKRKDFATEQEWKEDINKKKAKYLKFREYYNKQENKDYRDLYLLSCYSINHLMRFNQKSEFNVNYGSTQRYIKNYIVNTYDDIKDINIICGDYKDINIVIADDTFVYCDPPYLNTTAVYNEKRAFGGWNLNNDYELFEYLEDLNNKGVKWGLSNVFVNRGITNQHLIDWCEKNNWNVYHLDRNYNPFNRGNSDSDEVYICNYEIGERK